MAKPIGPKTTLIRDAIKAHPDKSNKELAELINNSPARADVKIKVTPNDIAQQKQNLKEAAKKAGANGAAAAPEPASAPATTPAASAAKSANGRKKGKGGRPKGAGQGTK